jgi:hypothetical protein
LRSSKSELRAVQVRVIRQDLKIARRTSLVTHARQPHRVLSGCRLLLLLLTILARLVVRDQSVGDIAKSSGDGLLIGIEKFFVGCLGQTIVIAYLAAVKDRLAECARRLVVHVTGLYKLLQLRTARSALNGERKLREVLGARDADVRIRLNQQLLRTAYVGTALQ